MLSAALCGAMVVAEESRPTPPAEELRLNTVQFREWLKARGLTEVLDLHLRDFPPTDPTATLLMTREIKLAQFADRSRSLEERRAAIAEANRILERLADDLPQDRRRLTWQYTLAYSLLYDEAEPFATNVLYFGGSDDDRRQLGMLASRALAVARGLSRFITGEYARIDKLTAEQFEEIEQRGYLDELDRMAPSVEYLLLWILFYDALPREEADPARAANLREILETLAVKPAFLQTVHDKSRIQAQALLLAGMTHRRMNDHSAAREHLERSLAVAERVGDVAEKQRLAWAVTLATVEIVRNDRDDGRFDAALAGAARLRDLGARQSDPFTLRFVAALLERSIHRTRAASQGKAGRKVESGSSREQAWMTLAKLVGEFPERKDAVYTTIYHQLGENADHATLDSFEQCALMTGLLGEAERRPEAAAALLDRAVAVGEYWLAHPPDNARLLAPEVLFELGVAHHRRGDRLAAAKRLLEAAEQYPRSTVAGAAAGLAVQLAAELNTQQRGVPEIDRLYRHALEVLLKDHADTDAGRYWRFFYAQLLDESGEFAAAGREYDQVDAMHEHYLEAGFLRVQAAASELRRLCSDARTEPAARVAAADAVITAGRAFDVRVQEQLAEGGSAERLGRARQLSAEARILIADAMLAPGVDRAAAALEMVADFEKNYGDQSELLARVWRVRLLAQHSLGRLDEAAAALPKFVAADPASAGATLQALYRSLAVDLERSRDQAAPRRSADLALLLAEQLDQWAKDNDPSVIGMDRRAIRVQLAEAHLRAGHAAQAQQIFEETAGAPTQLDTATDVLASFGQAEALFQQKRYADALPKYNRLATTLATDHPLRWKSLLGDLQCRTLLGEPPAGILKVIEQQRFLFPTLGGPDTAAQFDRLKRENERRRDGG